MVVKSGGEAALAEWQGCFAEFLPGLTLRWWDDPSLDPTAIDYALVWAPEAGRLRRFVNLKAIFGAGAGVDLITRDPDWPSHVPLVRCVPPEAGQRMAEYVIWAALSIVRDARRMVSAQHSGHWDEFEPARTARDYRLGIMGLGEIGQAVAQAVRAVGFQVQGWSRTPKNLPGIRGFAGADERDAFLASTDILVCLLPATPETAGMIAAPLLSCLPKGASLIQVGRGMHHNMADILAALGTGQLAGAIMDVFDQEPLPADHPAWRHPRITISPHNASTPTRRERARFIAGAIQALHRGETFSCLYDPKRGY
ncbi:MAG: glyoxylate/hydroxypyruvate reductase A [Roseomonas sp.]|nr:glyoxylate/hydroxypyruvate reductase A [Roseomonas sp.]